MFVVYVTGTISNIQYPLTSRYTPSVCVTSSLETIPPSASILTSFSLEVPLS